MKIKLPLFSLILSLALAPAVFAEDAPKGPPREKEPETELGNKMDKINGAWRKLRAQAADATKNEDSLKQVAIIKAGMADAVHLEPARKADIPAAEQAKFVADYQAKMKEFMGEVDKLEGLLKAGKNEEAAAQVKVLGDLQKQDHKTFKKETKKKME
jgi:soluble cytochrome b562